MFEHGKDFEWTFETDLGPVGVLATVTIEGDRVILNDLSFFPRGAAGRLPIGTRRVRAIFREIREMARSQGFAAIGIEAERLSGKNPGRTISIKRGLL
jgi:hypothetical protein